MATEAMAKGDERDGEASMSAREDRLKSALRANLRRRKAVDRTQTAQASAADPTSTDGDADRS